MDVHDLKLLVSHLSMHKSAVNYLADQFYRVLAYKSVYMPVSQFILNYFSYLTYKYQIHPITNLVSNGFPVIYKIFSQPPHLKYTTYWTIRLLEQANK